MKRGLIWAIIFTICHASGVGLIVADAAPVNKPNNLDMFFDDMVLRGSEAYQDSFFEIGKGMKVMDGSYLDIYFGHTPELIPEYSSLHVLVDDLPIESVQLTADNVKETNLRIPLSPLQLEEGFHKITIRAYMKVALGICEDPQLAAAWTVLYKKSKIVLNLDKVYDQADLSWYPSPFIERGTVDPLNTILIVPDQFGQASFAVAAGLTQYFTTQAPGKRLNVPIYTESELTDSLLQTNNAIWIGTSGQWRTNGKTAMEAARQAASIPADTDGFIIITPSPWNSEYEQLMVSGNENQLYSGVAILTTESLYRQLKGLIEWLPDDLSQQVEPNNITLGEPYIVSLEQLGYDNISVKDIRKGTMEINYTLPGNWDFENGATLHLVYSHSKAILFHTSVMTVSLNGVPVKSINFTKETGDKAEMEIALLPSMIGNNRSLNIKFGLEFTNPPAEYDQLEDPERLCADTLIGNWAVIDKSSTLSFTPVERQSFYLQSMPYPFLKEGQWNQTAFLFGGSGSVELNTAMTLIGRFGHSMLPTPDHLHVFRTTDPDVADKLKAYNVIYIGTYRELPEFLNGYEQSYVRFEAATMHSQAPEVELLDSLKHNAAVMQLTRSPLSDDRSVLLVAAASRSLLSTIVQSLIDLEQSGQISSRLAAIDQWGKVYPFPATEDPYTPLDTIVPKSAAMWGDWSTDRNIFTAAYLLAMLVIAALFVLYRRSKR